MLINVGRFASPSMADVQALLPTSDRAGVDDALL
jgi:hypothetical protein